MQPSPPFGLHRLGEARKVGYLIIVEGETCTMTSWQHKYPALGIPGAGNVGCLQSEYFTGIQRIYVIQEPDRAGNNFPSEVNKRLAEIGYQGRVYAVDLYEAAGVKDINDLHRLDVKAFKVTFEKALRQSMPLFPCIKPETFLLRDLQQKILPEPQWAIPEILPEGLTILAGKPKLGKSWLALALLIAISSGGVALERYPVEQGEVLYLDLEDNIRRLQRRTNTFLQHTLASEDFYAATSWPRIDQGGLEALEIWIDEHPRTRLIVIDTWARFKPKVKGWQKLLYDEDYDAITPLQEFAARRAVSILVVDHMRKMESADPLDMISGSTGKTGAVDGFLLLYRKPGEEDPRLAVIGRDIEEEQELFLTFNRECASWTVKGDVNESTIASSHEQQEILDVLIRATGGLRLKDITKELGGKNESTTRNLLVKLRNEGKVLLSNNTYCVVTIVRDSKSSNRSNHSNLSEKEPELEQEVTTGYYGVTTVGDRGVVTRSNPLSEPVEPLANGHSHQVTMVTTVTTDSPRKGETPARLANMNRYKAAALADCGSLKYCDCGAEAIGWRAGGLPYCRQHWPAMEAHG